MVYFLLDKILNHQKLVFHTISLTSRTECISTLSSCFIVFPFFWRMKKRGNFLSCPTQSYTSYMVQWNDQWLCKSPQAGCGKNNYYVLNVKWSEVFWRNKALRSRYWGITYWPLQQGMFLALLVLFAPFFGGGGGWGLQSSFTRAYDLDWLNTKPVKSLHSTRGH